MGVTLKLHRFDISAAALLALAAAAYAFFVESRLSAIGAPPECVSNWLTEGAGGREHCLPYMARWGAVFTGQADHLWTLMSVVPFAAGLLAGVPIVSRELETRTVQTAWSLNASRVAWLARQAMPLFFVLLMSITVAAVAAGVIAEHRIDWGESAHAVIGLHGLPTILRASAAFAVGLFAGALLARAIPALVVGVLVLALTHAAADIVRNRWVEAQPPTVIGESLTAVTVDWRWRTPDGALITIEEAESLVPAGNSVPDDLGYGAAEWLEANGYLAVPLGVSDEAASGWVLYDMAINGLLGLVAVGGSYVIVDRRRPR